MGEIWGRSYFLMRPQNILTASAEERATRRYKQLKNKGMDVNFAALLDSIKARDERDSSRW